jgi:hypothetical protein
MEGVNSAMIFLIQCKNFCKCHNVSPAQNKKIENVFSYFHCRAKIILNKVTQSRKNLFKVVRIAERLTQLH